MSQGHGTKKSILFVLTLIMLALGSYNTLGAALSTDVPVVSVISASMEPTYHRGDLLVVRGAEMDQIEIGDVIVFTRPDHRVPVVHRVIEKKDTYVATKGDNNALQLPFEKKITFDRIKGKAVFAIPKIGYLRILPWELFGGSSAAS